MSGRTNPPHDRVSLSSDERRRLDRLEVAFELASYGRRHRAGRRRLAGVRDRVGAAWLRTTEHGTRLLALGALLLLVAFAPSLVIGVLGATMLAVGSLATARSPMLRARLIRRRERRP